MHAYAWRTTRLALLLCGLSLLTAEAAMGAGSAPNAPPAKPAGPKPGPLILEDTPAPLVPSRPRTEADRDRIEALALFATARTLEHDGDAAGALRYYQRAFRYDPSSATVVRPIVALAFRLGRNEEAIRYALKAVELEPADPLLLRSLAKHLVESGDLEHAVTLYEKALAARSGEKPNAADVVMELEMSQFHHLVGQHEKAAEDAAKVIYALEHPDEFSLDEKALGLIRGEKGATYNLFGEDFLEAGRFDDAMAAFEKAHAQGSDAGLFGYHRAQVLAKTGRPAEALQSLAAYFKGHEAGEEASPYELLAQVLKALDKEDELIGRLEKLHAEDPENVPLGYFLAEKYREAARFDKARPLYLQMLAKKPLLSGYRSLVDIDRRTNQPDKLLDVLGQLAGKTGSLDLLGAEGEALFGDTALVDRVVEAARARLKKDPKSLGYEDRLAVALLAEQCKQPGVAGEFFDLAIKARPESAGELLLLWGVGLMVDGDPAGAARVFQRGIDQKALPEGNPAFLFYLAGALEMEGRTDEALAAAKKLASIGPDSARFASRKAWILYHAKRYPDAKKAYAALVKRFDSDYKSSETRQVLREARLALSNICVLDGRTAEGEEWLQQVLDEFPDDVGALNDLGYLWADQGEHLERSLRMIRKAVEAEPDNIAYRDSLGWALFRLHRYKEAVVELESAAAGDEPDAEILDHLGDAYRELDQLDRARKAWQRAVAAFRKAGDNKQAEKVQRKIDKGNQKNSNHAG